MNSPPPASVSAPSDRAPDPVSGAPVRRRSAGSHAPVIAASATRRPDVRRSTSPSPGSTRRIDGEGVRANDGAGASSLTKWLARTAITSGAGADSSTVIVGVLRCDPRCSTGLVSTAIERVRLRPHVQRLGGVAGADALAQQPVAVVELHRAGSTAPRPARRAVDSRSTRLVASSMRCDTGADLLGLLYQRPQCHLPQPAHVLAHRGQRRRAPLRRRRVVVAHHREVLGTRTPARRAASSTPRAQRSEAAKIAVGGAARPSSSIAHRHAGRHR